MSQSSLTSRSLVEPPSAAPEYASSDEVLTAITLLNSAELKKLRLVAWLHCRHFGIPSGHMEPEDLLHEAIRRTLSLDKKWRKGVGIIHHLGRAMENIAGHEVPRMTRRVDVPGSQANNPESDGNDDPLDSLQSPSNPDGTVFAQVEAREKLRALDQIFNDDKAALRVLICRAAGQEGREIQNSLKLTDNEYEAISRRILRKTKQYYEPKSQAIHPGRGA